MKSASCCLTWGASAVPASDDKKAKPGGKVQDDLRALALLLSAMLEGGEGSFDSSQAVLPLRLRNPAVPARIDAVLQRDQRFFGQWRQGGAL